MRFPWKTRTSLLARMSLLFGLLVTVPLVISGIVLSMAGWSSVEQSGKKVAEIGQGALEQTSDRFTRVAGDKLDNAAAGVAQLGSDRLKVTSEKAVEAGKLALKENASRMSRRGQEAVTAATRQMVDVGETKVRESLDRLGRTNRESLQLLSENFSARMKTELDTSSSPVETTLERSLLNSWELAADRRIAAVRDYEYLAQSEIGLRLQYPLKTTEIIQRTKGAARVLGLVAKGDKSRVEVVRVVLVSTTGDEIARVEPGVANPEEQDWENSAARKALLDSPQATVIVEPVQYDEKSKSWIRRIIHRVVASESPPDPAAAVGALEPSPFVVVDAKLDGVAELAAADTGMQVLVVQEGTGRVVSAHDRKLVNSQANRILEKLPTGDEAGTWINRSLQLVYTTGDNTDMVARARYWGGDPKGPEDRCWTVVAQARAQVLQPVIQLEADIKTAWEQALKNVEGNAASFIKDRRDVAGKIQQDLISHAHRQMQEREALLRQGVQRDFNTEQAALVRQLERSLATQVGKLQADAGQEMQRRAGEQARSAIDEVKSRAVLETATAKGKVEFEARRVAQDVALQWLVNSAWMIPLFLVLALFLATMTSRSLVKPINQLVTGTMALAQGDYSRRIPVQGDDELTRLARAFNAMAEAVETGQADLRQSHASLASEKARIEGIVEASPDGLVMLESTGQVAFMNPAAIRLLGISGSPLPEAPFEVPQLPEAVAGRLQECLALVAESEEAQEYEFADPQRLVLQLREVQLRARDGRSFGRLLHLHDVTRERIIDEMKSDFISLVSHELRTPLTSILGFSSYMLTGRMGSVAEHQRTALESIHRQARRLSAIISDFLDISRIESGRIEMKKEELSIENLARRVIEDLRPQASEKNIRVDTRVENGSLPPLAIGDEQRIAQVLTNLVGNSLKFTEGNGRVDVLVSRQNGEVVCRVRDTGCGIPPDELDRVFDRFYQVEKVVIRKSGGTGLGLAIVKNIVEAHGGRIWIESELGRGTQVSFTLPCSDN